MKQVTGNYLGLVINTDDPERRGRIQVFIPSISTTLYTDWNEKLKDLNFRTLTSPPFTEKILEELKSLLPWAEAAVPFWGGGTGAPINESTLSPTEMPTDSAFSIPPDGAGGGGVSKNNSRGRSADISAELEQTIARGLAGTGINWESQSGTGGGVAGSYHLSGNASDGVFKDAVTNAILDPNNAEDKGKISYALWSLTKAGIGGVGWDGSVSAGGTGRYYMGDTAFHLDIGPGGRNWGDSTRSDTAASWIINARTRRTAEKPAPSQSVPESAKRDPREVAVKDGIRNSDGEKSAETEAIGQAAGGADTPPPKLLPIPGEEGSGSTASGSTVTSGGGDEPTVTVSGTSGTSGPVVDTGGIPGEDTRFAEDLYGSEASSSDSDSQQPLSGNKDTQVLHKTDWGVQTAGDVSTSRYGGPMGYFSTPAVGSKVWVFFEAENPQFPVYFACAYEPSNAKSVDSGYIQDGSSGGGGGGGGEEQPLEPLPPLPDEDSGGTIPDTRANNAPGSGEGMAPVEPDLPE